MFAMREITEDEYKEVNQLMVDCQNAINDREAKEQLAFQTIEDKLCCIGVTGVEDRWEFCEYWEMVYWLWGRELVCLVPMLPQTLILSDFRWYITLSWTVLYKLVSFLGLFGQSIQREILPN